MYCDIIHEERKKEYSECPFCNETLEETKSAQTKCCHNPDLMVPIRCVKIAVQ